MSFAEVLAEIPKLTPEQRRELLRLVQSVENDPGTAAPDFVSKRPNGRLVLSAPRVIRQAEIDAILSEFP
ncbi:MAG: hypothetical protein ABI217_04395 [Chthoniobacterales bacterium]